MIVLGYLVVNLLSGVFYTSLVQQTPPQPGQNLLQNAGFEDWLQNSQGQDSIPVGWYIYYASGASITQRKKVEGYRGYALQVGYTGNPSGYDVAVRQMVDLRQVPVTDTILASAMIRYFGRGNMKARVWLLFYDQAYIPIRSTVITSNYTDSSSTEWQTTFWKFTRQITDTLGNPHIADSCRFEVRLYKVPTSFTAEDSIIIDEAFLGLVVTGVNENLWAGVKVSNVVRTNLNLSLSLNKEEKVNCALYDAEGRLVKALYSGPVFGEKTLSFDVSGLKKGLYFVRVDMGGTGRCYRILKL